jgi:4-amino-4-deoxy-L-arabinose transferase-like glycosyltransferase
MYFLTAIPRVFYPYDLDIVEDGLLMEALRVADDQPIFVPPNADFIPDTYMPLYFWLGGVLFKVTGPSFAPLRLLSLAATVLTGGLIFWIARRESGLGWVAIVCAGLFLGGCRISGFSYELARVDALLVMLTLAGLTPGVYGAGSDRGLVLAAISLALAFLTKQIGLIFGIGLAIHLLVTIGRRAWFVTTFGLLTVGPWIG